MKPTRYPLLKSIATQGKPYGKAAVLHAAEMEAEMEDLATEAEVGIPTPPPGDGNVEQEECSQEVDELGLVHQHCEKLGLGDKAEISVDDKLALEQLLKEAGSAELAQYIAVMDPVEFEDFLVNTIYG